jgi:hypothetical protein
LWQCPVVRENDVDLGRSLQQRIDESGGADDVDALNDETDERIDGDDGSHY